MSCQVVKKNFKIPKKTRCRKTRRQENNEWKDRHTDNIRTDKQIERWTETQIDRQTDGKTYRYTGINMDRQTDGQM